MIEKNIRQTGDDAPASSPCSSPARHRASVGSNNVGRRRFCHDVDLFAFKNQIGRTPHHPPRSFLGRDCRDALPQVGMRIALPMKQKHTLRFSATLFTSQSSSLSFPLLSLAELSVGDNARQFLRRLLPRRRTMDPPAAPLHLLVFLLHPPALVPLLLLLLPPLPLSLLVCDPSSPSFRNVFLVLRLAASLFPASSPGEDSSVRAQPLAYNETENLRGTRGMRRMITYIETKNRPTRRSAALSLVLLPCLSASQKHRGTSTSRSDRSENRSSRPNVVGVAPRNNRFLKSAVETLLYFFIIELITKSYIS